MSLEESESREAWTAFLQGLRRRGMGEPLMVTSDANDGIRAALGDVFPGAAWQRCQFHFSKNVSEKAPRKYQAGIRQELTAMFNSASVEEARRRCGAIASDYRDVAEQAVSCLEEGFESAMTVMALPAALRPTCARTTTSSASTARSSGARA